jgi:tetratricopeptide (TPR) repeat protein
MRTKALAIMMICASLAFCASSQARSQRKLDKDPRYQYNQGLARLNLGYVDEASGYFQRAISIDARFYLAWHALGIAHAMKGRFDEAAKAYQKSLEINPQFAEGHNYLGTAYVELNLFDKAEREFRTAAEDLTYQKRELPLINLAKLYARQNRLDEAFESVQKSLQIQPREAMALNLRGFILEKKENLPDAIASYEQAVKLVPDDIMFSYYLAVASFKNGDYARAKEIFLKIEPRVTDLEAKSAIANYLKQIREKGRPLS